MNLWNDTFRIELFFKSTDKEEKRKTITHKGSLKSAIRNIFKEYGNVHMTANFYNSKGTWLKEIGF
ncbi:hypothetical protein [Bacillus multifaciens]|uniref:hypothetical protein n=1 Tax=Bacillus multifaciens TaxID=3068506 RepID=UPI0027429B09|nr:hypothetical protein [Bacillus sp. WLY-B-L8]MDP7979124.1 hypothetical protein [Bacillus sp. WLY-B-L8]